MASLTPASCSLPALPSGRFFSGSISWRDRQDSAPLFAIQGVRSQPKASGAALARLRVGREGPAVRQLQSVLRAPRPPYHAKASAPQKADDIVLDMENLAGFGTIVVPRDLWRALGRFAAWVEPALIADGCGSCAAMPSGRGRVPDEVM